jgi:membrane-bound serine protease (ClpP class)
VVLLAIVLILVGVALLVAEAHVPSGALGAGGAVAVAAGAALALGNAGAGVGLVIVGMVATAAVALTWVAFVARTALRTTRRRRISSGREALSGAHGVVRSWAGGSGQVLVDGALWRAKPNALDPPSSPLHTGDAVVVEHVDGLTLTVRRAEEWEVL